jgi:hypothetical protein
VNAMSRPRYSIGTLLLMVLFAGVAFAPLKSPSELWASALFTLAVAFLLVAVLLAVHRRVRARAYWLGFALFGWVYLILNLVPESAPRLATTGLLDALFARVHEHGHDGRIIWLAYSPQGDRLIPRGGGPTTTQLWETTTGKPLNVTSVKPEGFRLVGHSLITLLIACVGGWVSRRLHEAQDRKPSGSPEGGDSRATCCGPA